MCIRDSVIDELGLGIGFVSPLKGLGNVVFSDDLHPQRLTHGAVSVSYTHLNSFSIDGQAITDQQSKVFSNQLPSDAVQSLEVISGAPPAEYGGKTSLVIVATTRSGQGITKPTGAISGSYGSFGSATTGVDLSYGGKKDVYKRQIPWRS